MHCRHSPDTYRYQRDMDQIHMYMQSVDAKTGAHASFGRNPVNIQVVLPSLVKNEKKMDLIAA